MVTKTKPKLVLASQILQRTITDFTKNPEHWIQGNWGIEKQVPLDDDEYDKWLDAADNAIFPYVKEPGDGSFIATDIFEELGEVVHEPTKYCGLGGIQQSAYRMNKTNFWDSKFQKQLTLLGIYLNMAARKRFFEYVGYDNTKVTENFTEFVGFNDDPNTKLADVLKLFREVLKELKAIEQKAAEKAATRAKPQS